MRPLIIGPEQQEALDALKAYARAHPFGWREMAELNRRASQPNAPWHLMDAQHYLTLPHNFEVSLTYEIQPQPDTAAELRVWHVGVCLLDQKPGRAPHPAAIEFILQSLHLPTMAEALKVDIWEQTVIHLWFDAGNAPTERKAHEETHRTATE